MFYYTRVQILSIVNTKLKSKAQKTQQITPYFFFLNKWNFNLLLLLLYSYYFEILAKSTIFNMYIKLLRKNYAIPKVREKKTLTLVTQLSINIRIQITVHKVFKPFLLRLGRNLTMKLDDVLSPTNILLFIEFNYIDRIT